MLPIRIYHKYSNFMRIAFIRQLAVLIFFYPHPHTHSTSTTNAKTITGWHYEADDRASYVTQRHKSNAFAQLGWICRAALIFWWLVAGVIPDGKCIFDIFKRTFIAYILADKRLKTRPPKSSIHSKWNEPRRKKNRNFRNQLQLLHFHSNIKQIKCYDWKISL